MDLSDSYLGSQELVDVSSWTVFFAASFDRDQHFVRDEDDGLDFVDHLELEPSSSHCGSEV